MNRHALTKSVAGALLTGASLFSGNAAFATVAGGLGINWTSEGLDALAEALHPPEAGSPLARAHARALRRALRILEADYRRTQDSHSDGAAFALLSESADSLAQAEVTRPMTSGLAGAEQALAAHLPALLHGHDERQVAWLEPRLLPAFARAFREELEWDTDARQLFSLHLIEQVARRGEALGIAAAQLPALFDALASANHQLDTIQLSQAALEAQLGRLSLGQGGTLNHQIADATGQGSVAEVDIEGEPPPAPSMPTQGTLNNQSAFACEGGQARVNIRRIPSPSTPDRRLSLLALFADPAPRFEPLDLLREVRALEEALRPHEATFRLRIVKAAQVDDLCRGLRDEQPHLLHLAGHGTSEGFCFCDERGETQFARWSDLAEEIATYVPPLRAVIVAACHSPEVAQLCAPYVIALPSALADEVGVVFSQGFYEALVATPEDIPRAHAAGCRRARLKLHCDEVALPQLYRNNSE